MQQLNVFFLASYELILSFISCMATIYFSIRLLNKFVLSKPVEWFIKEKHEAGCLICGALMFSILYLVHGSIGHSTSALQSLLLSHGKFSLTIFAVAISHFFVFYGITFFTAFGSIYVISIILRKMMAPIDFDQEVELKKSLGLSMFLSFIVTGVTVFIQPGMNHFLGSLVLHNMLDNL